MQQPAVAIRTNGGIVTALAVGQTTFRFVSSVSGCSSLPSNPFPGLQQTNHTAYWKFEYMRWQQHTIVAVNRRCMAKYQPFRCHDHQFRLSNRSYQWYSSVYIRRSCERLYFRSFNCGCWCTKPTVHFTRPNYLVRRKYHNAVSHIRGTWQSSNPAAATIKCRCGLQVWRKAWKATLPLLLSGGCVSDPFTLSRCKWQTQYLGYWTIGNLSGRNRVSCNLMPTYGTLGKFQTSLLPSPMQVWLLACRNRLSLYLRNQLPAVVNDSFKTVLQ